MSDPLTLVIDADYEGQCDWQLGGWCCQRPPHPDSEHLFIVDEHDFFAEDAPQRALLHRGTPSVRDIHRGGEHT